MSDQPPRSDAGDDTEVSPSRASISIEDVLTEEDKVRLDEAHARAAEEKDE